jgi:signal transduction histidine kinase
MPDNSNDYLRLLFDWGNPVYYSIFLTVTISIIIFFFFRYIILPLRRKHILEKKELELKNVKLMALFAELDPNPLIRITRDGIIIHLNDAAKNLEKDNPLQGEKINKIIPSINFSVDELIKKEQSVVLTETIDDKFYSIIFKGHSFLNIAQIYFDDLTVRKQFEEELEFSKMKLRELSMHLRDTLEDERQRIARELHDGIGQNLHFIRLKLKNFEESQTKSFSEIDYNILFNSIESSISELKEIIYNLKPKNLDEIGLGASLKILIKRISEETEIKGTVDICGTEERLNKKLGLTLYRIAQEAISNIVKHSKATEFNVQVIYEEDTIKLIISDDGIGFDPAYTNHKSNSSGFGLLNMHERIGSYNGKLKIDSSKGNGTLIITEIPREEFVYE